MTRPGAAEWSVLQLDSDPVPGDSESFSEITRAYQELARSTQEAHDLLASGGQIDVGQGKAMEAFRDLIGKLPGRLDTMARSYGQAADAYLRYLPSLQEAQSMSLRALEEARQASQDQGSSQVALAAAQAVMVALGGATDTDLAKKDAATDDLTAARNRQAQADQALDQAKALLGQATALHDQAGRTAAQVIRQLAKDAPQRSLWEKIAEAFQAFVDFLRSTVIEWITTVLDVLSAIAGFIFPPLGQAIGLLSGAIDFASALAGGNAGEIAMAAGGMALGLVPGGRLVGRVMKFAAKGGKLLPGSVSGGIKAGTKSLDGGGRQIGGVLGKGSPGIGANRPPVPKDTSISLDVRECVTDPVDIATGDMVLAQVDLDLPGALPLLVERTHLSSYRAGGWFGPSWASTLDQRLEFDAEGICYLSPDGMTLVYPPVPVEGSALPLEGPRWPLTLLADGRAELTDPVLGRTTRFRVLGTVGVVSAVLDGDGNRLEIERDDRQAPTGLRHSDGRRVAVTTDNGRITALHLVALDGRAVALAGYGYDRRRRLVEVANASGRPLRFGYDDAGRIVDWTDRNGVGYRYTYDADGRCVRTEGDGGFLDGTIAYDRERRVTTYTDSVGGTTVYELDEAHHTVRRTDPLGGVTAFEWGRYNQLLAQVDPLGRITRYRYDTAGRLVAITRPDGSEALVSASGTAMTIAVRAGERIFARGYDRAPDPTAVGVAEPFDYDRLRTNHPRRDTALAGRQVTRTGERGRAERVRYDDEGNPVERIDAADQVTRTEYGPFDLVVATVDATGARTGYEYDTELRLTRVTDPRGLVWHYGYDAAGRLAEESDFNGRVRRYEYDAAGQLVRSTNGLGEVTEYDHDLLGNVVERRTPSGTTTYAYDPIGRLVAATNADAALVIERDEQGRVLTQTTNGRTLEFDYGRDGTRHRRTPSGADSVWAYDPFGNLESLVAGGHTVGFRHDPGGRELRRSLDGRVVLEQTFGDDRELTAQAVPGRRQRRFEYRADGRLAGIQDTLAGRVDFELDPAGRVTGVRGPNRAERYRYDPAGNLTSASVAGAGQVGELRYDGNLVTEAGGVRYTYDREGRTISRTLTDPDAGELVWYFVWDAHDRLIGVSTPDDDRWDYVYDPLGRRIGKRRYTASDPRDPVEWVDFVWDGPLLVEEVHTDARGHRRTVTWDHHPGHGHPVAQSVRVAAGPDQADGELVDERFYSIVTDLVGTPTELVDSDGELAWQGGDSLWGVPSATAGGATGRNDPPTMPLRFPGQYLDPETGLHYNVYRYYDPISGRYVSQDPLGLAPAPDPAGYVDNPYSSADPLGLAPCNIRADTIVPLRPDGGFDAALLNRPGSSGPRPDDLDGPDADLGDIGRQNLADYELYAHPVGIKQSLIPNPTKPDMVFHGSSEPPEVIFNTGLKSRAEQAGTVPHYDIAKHMHNGKGSGFVSTTGNLDVALQFVRSDGTKISSGGKTFDKRDGYIYVVEPRNPMVHLPTQNMPNLDHLKYQDEWAAIDNIPPGLIKQGIHVQGHYNVLPDGKGGLRIEAPTDPNFGIKMTGQENDRFVRSS